MFSCSISAALYGLRVCMIHVEADVSDGLPLFNLVGYLGSSVKEAKDRVRISIKNSGYKLHTKRITVNLSPADLRKEGTAFDLAIAVSVLAAYEVIASETLENLVIIGELGLDGAVKSISGILPIVCTAKEKGYHACIVPWDNQKEGGIVKGIPVIGVRTLQETIELLIKYASGQDVFANKAREESFGSNVIPLSYEEQGEELDFQDICGQEMMKRAMEVAAAGMHNILMIGPPGSGKTMMAKRLPGILPDLSFEEGLEISKIYSVAGLLNNKRYFITKRPFRSPHHTITDTAMVGGGLIPKPGELSLALGGVLFLDELSEFRKSTLELLRQPLEDGYVTISRLYGTYRYPTNFMLVAAMNPCNCGFYPDRSRCNCSPYQVKKYLSKLSQPFLDRIDICAEAQEVKYRQLDAKETKECSLAIRQRVKDARERQEKRYKNESFHWNSALPVKAVQKYIGLGESQKNYVEDIFKNLKLSARAYHRILKVAKTIADLDDQEQVQEIHIREAVCYRSLDKKYWGYDND